MMSAILLAALVVVAPEAVDPQEACEAASMVLKDMRYVEGKYAEKGDFSHPKIQRRLASCVEIATLAAPHGEDVTFASIAIAYNESNFRQNVGKGGDGEVGRMQVIPGYHCKPYGDLDDGKGGCINPERAGVRAIRLARSRVLKKHRRHWGLHTGKDACKWGQRRTPTMCRVLREYNGSTTYATKVGGFIRSIRRSYERHTTLAAKG